MCRHPNPNPTDAGYEPCFAHQRLAATEDSLSTSEEDVNIFVHTLLCPVSLDSGVRKLSDTFFDALDIPVVDHYL